MLIQLWLDEGVCLARFQEAARKFRNISEIASDAMQHEVDVARKQEHNKCVLLVMDKFSKIADRSYAISLAEHRKAETEYILHRNFGKVQDVPVDRKEAPVRQSNVFKKHVVENIVSDNQLMDED